MKWSCKSAGRIRYLDLGELAPGRAEIRGRSVIGLVRLSFSPSLTFKLCVLFCYFLFVDWFKNR